MSSIGEAELTVNSRIVGKVRVLRLFADPAIYPRLALDIECALHEIPDAQFVAGVPVAGYEVTAIVGELRLAEHGSCVAPLYWADPHRTVRSYPHPYESQLRLVADLDPWRVERLEQLRGSSAPQFWVHLWLTLVAGGHDFRHEIRAFKLDVSREQWLQFLAGVRHDQFEIIEVRFDAGKAERFRKALEQVAAARSRIDAGDYNEAVGACRKALEAVSLESDVGKSAEAWKAALASGTDEHRADHYASIFGKLKQLAALTVHPTGEPVNYSRSEALFVVRTTENLLALFGDRTSKS